MLMIHNMSKVDRFLHYLVRGDEDSCWDWSGTKDANGYGRFRFKYATISSHRFSYEYFVGPIPEGLVIDHLCNNTSCQNPRHLEPKTIYANGARGFTPRRTILEKGVCNNGLHPIGSIEDVYQWKVGESTITVCKKCKHERYRRLFPKKVRP